jgi:phospholipid transport system substrate-binding protein
MPRITVKTSTAKFVAAFVLAAIMPAMAFANPSSEAHIQALIEKIHNEPAGSVSDIILDDADMPRIARFVLGKYGPRMSDEDVSLFTTRLEVFLRDFLSQRSDELSSGQLEIVSSDERRETDSIVTTRVSSALREPTIMRWRLLARDGDWRLVDVEIHGLWLSIEQRAQVVSALSQPGANVAALYPSENPTSGEN